jgi:hypothetical protein
LMTAEWHDLSLRVDIQAEYLAHGNPVPRQTIWRPRNARMQDSSLVGCALSLTRSVCPSLVRA